MSASNLHQLRSDLSLSLESLRGKALIRMIRAEASTFYASARLDLPNWLATLSKRTPKSYSPTLAWATKRREKTTEPSERHRLGLFRQCCQHSTGHLQATSNCTRQKASRGKPRCEIERPRVLERSRKNHLHLTITYHHSIPRSSPMFTPEKNDTVGNRLFPCGCVRSSEVRGIQRVIRVISH